MLDSQSASPMKRSMALWLVMSGFPTPNAMILSPLPAATSLLKYCVIARIRAWLQRQRGRVNRAKRRCGETEDADEAEGERDGLLSPHGSALVAEIVHRDLAPVYEAQRVSGRPAAELAERRSAATHGKYVGPTSSPYVALAGLRSSRL